MSAEPIDQGQFRRALGMFATGVTVITVQHGDQVHGMTANSFTSVSMDPPLVLFCVAKTTRMAGLIEGAAGFAINILAADQQLVSRQFAGAKKEEAARALTLERGPVAPLIDDCLVALSCRTDAIHEGGDHWIVVGRVIAIHDGDSPDDPPLVFYRSRYRDLVLPPAPAAPPEAWENDAIRIYHDEWSVDEGDVVEHAHTLPW